MNKNKIRIGLYGTNGHQLPLGNSAANPCDRAQVIAVADYARETPDGIRRYVSLEALLANPEIDLISLCSARRIEQAGHAIQCLEAGKHVLAEKPCAFDVKTLEKILDAARRSRCAFREMAATELNPSVQAIRRLVDTGELGTIVHVQAHKSYPWHSRRPQDIEVDGGLVRQVGIHAVRLIHGGTGLRIKSIQGLSTGLGNPGEGSIQMAAAFALALENGAVGSINLNYLNPPNFGRWNEEARPIWGNDQLRVFGTRGMAETVDGYSRNALYLLERGNAVELPIPGDIVSPVYIQHYVNYLLDGTPMPTPFEEEMSMTRAMLALHEASLTDDRVEVQYPDR